MKAVNARTTIKNPEVSYGEEQGLQFSVKCNVPAFWSTELLAKNARGYQTPSINCSRTAPIPLSEASLVTTIGTSERGWDSIGPNSIIDSGVLPFSAQYNGRNTMAAFGKKRW